MIHVSKIPEVMNNLDPKGKRKRFDITFRKVSSGELVEAKGVSLLTYFHRNGTLNVAFDNGEVRKIVLNSIVKINNGEVYL